ncbi:TPA: hypothetical protein DCR49_11910 [Candidatus Delongbacteria bacterium]|nr:hypothetical protein [Candidatus Delongbacteria bacterium]
MRKMGGKAARMEDRNEWISFVSGIVPGIYYMIDCFTEKGDGIVIQTPVYPPFIDSVLNQKRELLTCPFIRNGDK